MAENMILYSTLCYQNKNSKILSENQDINDENEIGTVEDDGERESNGSIDDNVVHASNPEVDMSDVIGLLHSSSFHLVQPSEVVWFRCYLLGFVNYRRLFLAAGQIANQV